MKLKLICFGALDLLILALLGLFFLYNKLGATPNARGFFCDDTSIGYPYKPNLVSWVTCALVAALLPLMVIGFVEALKIFCAEKQNNNLFMSLIKSFPIYAFPFCAGAVFEHMFVEIAKFQIGRLRPNFISVCHPLFEFGNATVNCQNVTKFPGAVHDYVTKYKCMRSNYRESQLSFPSGHTALITYAMVYLAAYLQVALPKPGPSFMLVRPIVQTGALAIAWFVSLSRISDNKHHWSDVLAGAIIGSLAAVVTLYNACKWAIWAQPSKSENSG